MLASVFIDEEKKLYIYIYGVGLHLVLNLLWVGLSSIDVLIFLSFFIFPIVENIASVLKIEVFKLLYNVR